MTAPLRFYSDTATARLQAAISQNRPYYLGEKPTWIVNPAGEETGELPIAFDPVELKLPDAKNDIDAENAAVLWECLKDLAPVQAADGRIWTWLTHAVWPDYIKARWPVRKSAKKKGAAILDRWFLCGRSIGALMGNSLSRLWWAAYMTRVEGDDPWRLTRTLFRVQDVATALMERSFGRSPHVLQTTLDWMDRNWDKMENYKGKQRMNGTQKNGASEAAKMIGKALNLHGGVAVLDCLSDREIENTISSVATSK